jgi:hypothetical protein
MDMAVFRQRANIAAAEQAAALNKNIFLNFRFYDRQ